MLLSVEVRVKWLQVVLGLLLLGACASGAQAPADGAQDAQGSATLDAAPALPCPATAVCQDNDVLTCASGQGQLQPCGTDAYCNRGVCVATTIVLPRDAAPHKDLSEWWYYTGHITDGDQKWGFEVTIFQADVKAMLNVDTGGYGYMCHVAVTDIAGDTHYQHETISLQPAIWQALPIVLEVDECHLELDGDGHDHIVAQIPQGMETWGKATPWTIDLTMEPKKRVTRHGGDGIIPMSTGGGSSWYYSYTRLATSGTLTTPQGPRAVTGQAWMDHQWGDFDISQFKGWDWWSLQLDDNREIMLFQFTDWNGQLVEKAGTIVDPDGTETELDGMDSFVVTPRRKWASTHTDGIYPLDWDITIPQGDWQLGVITHVDDQEMTNPAKNYWEGETGITGTRAGAGATGVGYTELTGYASNLTDPKQP